MITVGAALADHHGPAGPAALTEANGVSAAIGVLAPLAVGASVAAGFGWRPGLWIAIVMIVVLFLLRGRFGGAEHPAGTAGPRPETAGGRVAGHSARSTG